MTYYESPPLPHKQTEWRIVVIPFWLFPDQRCTQFQWRDQGTSDWHPDKEWPTWDGNTFKSGLPSVCSKLFYTHEADLKAVLAGRAMDQPAQPALFA